MEVAISRILIVDDDRTLLEAIRRALRSAGHEVVVAAEVEDAIEQIHLCELDCAIVDYTLPFGTGTTVLQALRRIRPHCARILLTGRSEGEVFRDAVNTGGAGQIISKPIGTSALLEAVQSALAQMGSVGHLSEAIRIDRLSLALQPIVRIEDDGSRVPFAHEALLRSSHPVLDTPTTLLEVAERHGWVMRLGAVVLELAAQRLEALPTDQLLFVNLHPTQLSDPGGLSRGLTHLDHAAERVVFEITERLDLSRIEGWEASVEVLRGRGFTIAMDDLGGGHATLTNLVRLKPRYIKIDMGLVQDLQHSPQQRDVIRFLQGFGATHHAAVIAEGVETSEELDALTDCGVRLVQGYYLGRPVP